MVFISFGKIDRNLIPILVGCIFSFLSRLLFTYKDTILFSHPLVSNIFATVSKYFTIIPFLIIKIKSYKAKKNIEKRTIIREGTSSIFIFRDAKKEVTKGKWKYIFLSGIIFFIQGSILFFTIEVKTNFYIWNILITCIFSYIIFKIKLFRHHYLSIILIILTGFILDFITENLQNDISKHWVQVLLRFIREIVFSLHDIINKSAMETKFCTVYDISFYTGLIVTVLFGIFSVFDYYFFKFDNFKEYIDNFDFKEFLVLLGYIITQLGLYLGALFTNKNNTPCHIFIIYVFGQLAYYVGDFSKNSIIVIICLVFILFWSLIFNEIIEINLCGLSGNTKRNIIKRADSEDFSVKKNISEQININDDVFIELKDEEEEVDD